MSKFRFQDFDIWKDAISLSKELLAIADELSKKKSFRFAEQLRAAIISISNNIAEGSGSDSDKEFSQFLNYSKRSVYETVNMLLLLCSLNYISENMTTELIDKLEFLSKRITKFRQSLNK